MMAVVVGGGSGIGAALSSRLRESGTEVLTWDIAGDRNMVVKVAAKEWAPGVRVNAVAPGVTDTPMLGPAPRDRGWLASVAGRTPLGRLGQADEIADAVVAVHGLSWVTGEVFDCDGGLLLHSPIDPTRRS